MQHFNVVTRSIDGPAPLMKRVTLVAAGLAGSLVLSGVLHAQVSTLPRAVAPGAYGAAVNSGVAPVAGVQDQLYAPPGVEEEVDSGFYPSLTIGVAKHDNALKTPDNEEEDIEVYVRPAIVWRADLDRHDFELGLSALFNRWQDFGELDQDSLSLSAALGLDIHEKVRGDLYAGITEGEETRGTTGARIDVRPDEEEDEYDETVIGGRITLGRLTNTLQAYVGLENSELDYKNNRQDQRDRDTDTISAGLHWNVAARTGLFINRAESDVDYTARTSVRDNEVSSTNLGIGWEPTDQTSLLLSVGDTEKDFDRNGLEDFDGTTYTGKVSWRPRDRTGVHLYGAKAVEDSTEFESSYFTSQLLGVSADQRLSDRWGLTGFYNKTDDEFSSGREDNLTDWGVGLNYGFSSWLTLGATYGVLERESTEREAEYEDERIGINLTTRFAKRD